ncbi:MAG: filamentous hemagglutinin N-terminal domain-containing protein [Cyanobacteria bacterium SBLK]|nr:filamentous hemagglutinin N-terminal domain-containing protein [Cyanobacteria bacterium SBLK]
MSACQVFSRYYSRYISVAIAIAAFVGISGKVMAVTPAMDGTGTQIVKTGDRFEISGGTLSGDGGNLFHSFGQFGLNAHEMANFLSSPQVQNILGRVTGGDPSIINGLIQVTGGNSNLYLMNPAGIVFGNGASLQVSGDFFATTATGIGFNGNWFEAMGSNDYGTLNGNPTHFAFDLVNAGTIVNGGNLGVNTGQNLTLLGGSVVNTGNLTAKGGNIAIAAVPGTSLVRISSPNNVLSLEIEPPRDAMGKMVAFDAFDLPELLTGMPPEVETHLVLAGQTAQTLAGTIVPTGGGTAIASGTIDVAAEVGGNIDILGDRVALIDNALLDASGDFGGGKVRIGGDFQGRGDVYNADYTYISPNTLILADALWEGDGGTAIAWADKTTRFHGEVSAKGGITSGDGGFVEISGKENLLFTGNVDVSALVGQHGTILFDPQDIIIEADDFVVDNNAELGDQQILFADGGATTFEIDDATLQGLTGNVRLEATRDIIFNTGVSLTGGNLLDQNLTLEAGRNITIQENLEFSSGNTLTMNAGGDITVQEILGGGMGDIHLTSTGGNITANGDIVQLTGNLTLQAASNIQIQGINANGAIALTSTNGDITIGSDSSNEVISGYFNGGNAGQVAITANNGLVTLNGWIHSGGTGKAQGSTIAISAARLRAINPFNAEVLDVDSYKASGAANAGGQTVTTPTSLFATPANVTLPFEGSITQTNVDTLPTGKIAISFAGDPNAIEVGSGETLISINLLEDTTFTVNQTLGATGSGTEGLIGIMAANIPPTVVVLLGDGDFSATIPPLDSGTGTTAAIMTTIPTTQATTEVSGTAISTSSTLSTEATTTGQTLEQSVSGCNSTNSNGADNESCEAIEPIEPRSLLTIEE